MSSRFSLNSLIFASNTSFCSASFFWNSSSTSLLIFSLPPSLLISHSFSITLILAILKPNRVPPFPSFLTLHRAPSLFPFLFLSTHSPSRYLLLVVSNCLRTLANFSHRLLSIEWSLLARRIPTSNLQITHLKYSMARSV